MQRLVSPQNTHPDDDPSFIVLTNKCFYLTLPFQQRASISSLFRCACAFTSKILSRILPGLDIAPLPLGLCPTGSNFHKRDRDVAEISATAISRISVQEDSDSLLVIDTDHNNPPLSEKQKRKKLGQRADYSTSLLYL